MPFFSIIIPNYNKEKYLKQCLNSVFNQTFKDFEVIFIDDNSTDNSLKIASEYNLIKLKTNRLMPGGARNKGLIKAKGEYIIFLDSDDYFFNNDVLNYIHSNIDEEDVIFLSFFNEKKNKEIIQKELTKEERIKKDKWLGCTSKCWKRSFINWKFPEKVLLEDIFFTLKGYCEMEKFKSLEKIIFVYTYDKNNTTQKENLRLSYRVQAKKAIETLSDEYKNISLWLKSRL